MQKDKLRHLGGKPIDYKSGMAAILHRHPKLLFKGSRFIGPVLTESSNGTNSVYRVREYFPEAGKVISSIYSSVLIGKKEKNLFGNPTGISAARFLETEAVCIFRR